MKNINIALRQDVLISKVYEAKREAIIGFIYKRIGRRVEAEDLAQDVFTQLLSCNTLLNETKLIYLIYTIARNLTIDYLRRNIRQQKASDYIYLSQESSSSSTEDQIALNDLMLAENRQIETMPAKQSRIYRLAIHEGLPVHEIATLCSISHRTVEHYIYISRREMRQALCSFVG